MSHASARVSLACAVAALAGLGFAGPAKADALQAASCSRGLAPEAMTIYQATAPEVSPGTNLYSVLKPTVISLIRSHQVQKGSARASAKAAGACLKLLE